MASEELAAVNELLRGIDMGDLTIAERRASFNAVAAPPPAGTAVEQVDAGGVPAEWVIPAGVNGARVLLYLHGGAYQIGSPATLRHMIALISAAAQTRVLSVDYRLAPEHPRPAPPAWTSPWKSGTRCRTAFTRSPACCPSPTRPSSESAPGSRH